jgi:phage tail sheath protein FI
MSDYQRPGVYIEEVSLLPPSVAGVSTAVPAFIGYTKKGETMTPTRISSFLEFQRLFGGPSTLAEEYTITFRDGKWTITNDNSNARKHFLYYALQLFYQYGDFPCYIVSVGYYDDSEAGHISDGFEKFNGAIKSLETVDEPTLILFPEATELEDSIYHSICNAALAQCQSRKDRFVIIDVKEKDDVQSSMNAFRSATGIGNNDLLFGAAYFPYLKSILSYKYEENSITVDDGKKYHETTQNGLLISYSGPFNNQPEVEIKADGTHISFSIDKETSTEKPKLVIEGVGEAGTVAKDIIGSWTLPMDGFELKLMGDGTDVVNPAEATGLTAKTTFPMLDSLKQTDTSTYNGARAYLNDQKVTLPPSSSIAGIYAKVDQERGVWKAPANMSLTGIIGPTMRISDAQQNLLNEDATSGKSINAIRTFTGKGTLVWGARTLAGNDNEWKFISVRRLFNTIEESIKKATEAFVFEPNNASTWIKVKGMIESYLFGLFQKGAFQGTKPEEAYWVKIGRGQTMTGEEINQGKMKVEVGIAAVRPAEFIVLQFAHKMIGS